MNRKDELKAIISKMGLYEKLKWINENADITAIINKIVSEFSDKEVEEEIKKLG